MYNRLFKLWYYTVSHQQMLLRSIGDDGVYNMDIYFADVTYIELPTKFDEIKIQKPTQEDINYITQRIGKTDKLITVLLCKNRKFFVVSSVIKIIENDLSMFQLPFDIPNDMTGIRYEDKPHCDL